MKDEKPDRSFLDRTPFEDYCYYDNMLNEKKKVPKRPAPKFTMPWWGYVLALLVLAKVFGYI